MGDCQEPAHHESFDLAAASFCLSLLSLHTIGTKWLQVETVFVAGGGPVIPAGQWWYGIATALGGPYQKYTLTWG